MWVSVCTCVGVNIVGVGMWVRGVSMRVSHHFTRTVPACDEDLRVYGRQTGPGQGRAR